MARKRRHAGFGFGAASDLVAIGFDAAWVIPLRLARIAAGGEAGLRESRLMVDEKLAATAAAMATLARGGSPATVARQVRRTVRANRKRLSG